MIQFTDLLEFRVRLFLTLLKNLIFKGCAEYHKWGYPIWCIQERITPVSTMPWAVCI